MKYSKTQPLKEILHQYIETMKLTAKLRETNLIMHWDKFVGTSMAKATTKLYITQGVLYVGLNSAIAKHELLMIKDALLSRIKSEFNGELIHNIVIL
jgi:hypothetical protein